MNEELRLKNHWESIVPKNHKHFIHKMDESTINRIKYRVKSYFFDKLNLNEIKSAYDWGAGGGIHTKTLSEFCNVIPLDISNESLNVCKEYTGINGILINELSELNLSKVDLIFSADVIHHFPSINYLNKVLDVWNSVLPKYICAQFKVSTTNIASSDYFTASNYVDGIFLTKTYIEDYLNNYEVYSYHEIPSASNRINHGFLILKLKQNV